MDVKRLAASALLVANLLANQAFAAETAQPETAQPLTRSDCDRVGFAWSENTNVCDTAKITRQPLTRADCVGANVKWNEGANICDVKGTTAAAAAKGASPAATTAAKDEAAPASSILITIDKSTQKMTVAVDGTDRYTWPVSTGRPIYATPSGTYTPSSMNEVWYSKEWDNAPMPHAIFFMKDGHAIHGSYEVKTLGKPVSHGCVRISPQNAIVLYGLVKATGLSHTQVVLTGTTPGGEEKVAAGRPRTSTRYTLAPEAQPQFRGGFFRRLFGGRQ